MSPSHATTPTTTTITVVADEFGRDLEAAYATIGRIVDEARDRVEGDAVDHRAARAARPQQPGALQVGEVERGGRGQAAERGADASRRQAAGTGLDPEHQHEINLAVINQALAGRPDGLTVTVHMCRGNYRSAWFSSIATPNGSPVHPRTNASASSAGSRDCSIRSARSIVRRMTVARFAGETPRSLRDPARVSAWVASRASPASASVASSGRQGPTPGAERRW